MKQNSGKLPATELCCEKEEKHFKCVKVPEVEIEMAEHLYACHICCYLQQGYLSGKER